MRRRHWLPLACICTLVGVSIAHAQTCPDNELEVGNEYSYPLQGRANSLSAENGYGKGTARYVNRGDTLTVDVLHGEYGTMGAADVYDRITLLGAPAGTPVPVTLTMRLTGSLSSNDGSPSGVNFDCSVDGVWFLYPFYSSTCDPQAQTCSGTFDQTFSFVMPFSPGVPRLFKSLIQLAHFESRDGEDRATLVRSFQNLPPGAFLVSCSSDTLTPVLGVRQEPVSGLALDAAWPNPARDEVHASCSLPRGGTAFLRLYDSQGRVVATRTVDPVSATRTMLTIGGRLEPGAYFLQLKQGAVSATRTVTIVR